MTQRNEVRPGAGNEPRKRSAGRMILLGFLAGGGFGFLVTLLYIIFR